ncbi:MAG: PaaX family transcriptional regulator C-terminal domain-containing protein [Myxococcota bacterium]
MSVLMPYLEPVIAQVSARRPVRTGSLLFTVMGDIVVPRGEVVWLGSIVQLLEPFGISHGQVRTAVMRLRREDWLTRESVGRRSFVGLTEPGRRRLDEATSRIYGDEPEPWSGGWTILLFPAGLQPRDSIRQALGWLGFGTLSHQAFLHPNPDRRALQSLVADAHQQLPPHAAPILIEGQSAHELLAEGGHASLTRLVENCWTLEPLQTSYDRLLAQFGPLADVLASRVAIEPREAVLLRVALIHEYRRVLLRDPWLPPAWLPEGWIGREARKLVSFVYRVILGPAEAWLDEHLEGPEGPLPASTSTILARLRT